MKLPKIVTVEWIDATTCTQHHKLKNAEKCEFSKCVSIGFLIKEDNEGITLAQTISNLNLDGCVEFGHTINIPKTFYVKKVGK